VDAVAYPKRGDVYVVTLEPTLGAEMQKIRPAIVISPDELNRHLATIIVAPITSTLRGYRYRVKCRLQNKPGSSALDQLRAVDKYPIAEKNQTDRRGPGARCAGTDVCPVTRSLQAFEGPGGEAAKR
jgi:mRNA interferase MazF